MKYRKSASFAPPDFILLRKIAAHHCQSVAHTAALLVREEAKILDLQVTDAEVQDLKRHMEERRHE